MNKPFSCIALTTLLTIFFIPLIRGKKKSGVNVILKSMIIAHIGNQLACGYIIPLYS